MPSDHMELEAATGERRRRRLHPLAGASFLLGLLSPLFAVAAAAAVVTGLWARRSIRRSEGRAWGNILAFTGAGLGCIGLAIQGISAHQAVMYYREVTPAAEEFLTLVAFVPDAAGVMDHLENHTPAPAAPVVWPDE